MRFTYIFFTIIFITFNSFANNRIAFVDVQKIIDNSLAVIDIRSEIDKINQNLQKEFLNTEDELKKLESHLLKKKETIDNAEFQNEVMKFNEKVTNAQKITQEKKIKLEQAHAKAISIVNNSAMEIIQNYTREKNFDIIMPSTQVLYASESLNITKEILNELNQSLPKVELEY